MKKGTFILLESYWDNNLLAIPYNQITPWMRDKYRLSGYIKFDNEDILTKKEFLLEPIISFNIIKNRMNRSEKSCIKNFKNRENYLNNLPAKKLKSLAEKCIQKNNAGFSYLFNDCESIRDNNLSDDLLKRVILSNEEFHGSIYREDSGRLIFSNINSKDLSKLGSANLLLKTIHPKKYCFSENYKPYPIIYIK